LKNYSFSKIVHNAYYERYIKFADT